MDVVGDMHSDYDSGSGVVNKTQPKVYSLLEMEFYSSTTHILMLYTQCNIRYVYVCILVCVIVFRQSTNHNLEYQ